VIWRVSLTPEARDELKQLPVRERAAMEEAFLKLRAEGDQLGAPHSSKVQGTSETLRELRPRRGSSPWRAFYRRIGDRMVVGAIGPEAVSNKRGFRRSVEDALERLRGFED